MKTFPKNQSFLANSSKKYFKLGLASSILICIAVFKFPIYAKSPNFETPIVPEDPDIIYVDQIIPIEELVERPKEKIAKVIHPVQTLLSSLDPVPALEPEKKIETPSLPFAEKVQVLKKDPPLIKPAWTYVERMPEFEGGLNEMYAFFKKNIRYDLKWLDYDLEGKVHVRFVVDPEGNITKVEVAAGVHPWLDSEAVRVVKSMPKWTPGEQNGEKVSVVMVLPINFVIQGSH